MIFLIFFLNLFFGCSDYVVHQVEKHQQEILVHPTNIDFGNLVSGKESGLEFFSVINTGDADLSIYSPELFDQENRFSITTIEESYVIQAGEVVDFYISYTPETFETNLGHIEILSDDADEPLSIVTLKGDGDAPVMVVEPKEFDYGAISIGCDNEERITIRNDGNLNLTVESVIQMVTQPVDIVMEYGSLPDPPWVLIPGQELDFLVSYVPQDIGYDESSITISGDDPYTPYLDVIQYGDGDIEQWHQQQFVQQEIPILDVLWVIDNSGSMNPFQQALASNINSFMSAFLASSPDFNMAVVTTDSYSFSAIIDNSTSNPEQSLSNLVVTGVMGSGHERGLLMSQNSLDNSSYAGPGGSFFRIDATLVVVYVSDEPDYSGDWTSFISFFDNLKPLGSFVPYSVIGDVPGGCIGQSGNYTVSAQAGYGYWDIVDYYGGNTYSICASDWGVQLTDLANSVTSRRTFLLDQPDPMESTIEVYVNGQSTTEWVYDSSNNAIIFNEDTVPETGQTIIIDYAVWGCGDT